MIVPSGNQAPVPAEAPASGGSSFAARIAATAAEGLGLTDARRVAALPLERELTPGEVEEISRQEVTPAFFDGTHPLCERDREGRPKPFRLWRQQADALRQFDASGSGAMCFLPVGKGKSLSSFMCLRRGHRVRGYRKSLLLIPARGVRKLVTSDLAKMERVLGFDVPVHVLAGLSPKKRGALVASGLSGVYVSTYSLAQRPTFDAEMDAIAPELVVADEGHHLLDVGSHAATRRRFEDHVERLRAALVVLSGTLFRKTLKNCWRLLVLALREKAPVPLDRIGAERWAEVIDASSGGPPPSLELLELLEPVRQKVLGWVREGRVDPMTVGGPLTADAEGMRRAFRVRRNLAPGVVAGAEDQLGATLAIENRPCWRQAIENPVLGGSESGDEKNQEALDRRVDLLEARLEQETPIPTPEDWSPREAFAHLSPFDQVIALLWAVRARHRTPNGDEIEFGFHVWRPQLEISAGIYNELIWPEPPDLARDRGISEEDAEGLIDRARDHRLSVRRYTREVRDFLQGDHVRGLDTHLLVALECSRGGSRVPRTLYDRWLGVHAADFEGRPEQISRPWRVCDWKIRGAVDWARDVEAEHGRDAGGIVWCWNVELAEWAHEIFLSEFGPDRVLYCPATARGDRMIQEPESAKFFTIASISAHGEQKDLFHYQHQVYVQFPRAANAAEQVLGRTHRYGQQADDLVARTLHTLAFDHQLYSAMLHDALWTHQMEGTQKVIAADYDPMPTNYPSRFLAERGFALDVVGEDRDRALRTVMGGAA